MSVIPAVIEQHAEKVAFLWLLRDAAVHEPHYSLSDLSVTKIEHSSDIGAYAIDSLKIK